MKEEIVLRDEVELIDGTKTREITMREPTRKDMKVIESMNLSDVDKSDAMLSTLTGISLESLEDMPMCDSNKLISILDKMGEFDYNPKK
ncbi:phage tail assembly protein [Francisella sp. SYW-9]|uniref:phage tail assembly protein n=1 Tax=Francisella sp. SYW-9 TaxID=2610888 RepID=UPI00168CE2B4|nr:phage tail assembly protein [Francisella sp. SYW-9]